MTTDRPIDGSAVAQILGALGESETKAVAQVVAIVDELGETESVALIDQARTVQKRGGMLTHDGRPRTLGGIYFALAREHLSEDSRREIFSVLPRRIKQGDTTWKPSPRPLGSATAGAPRSSKGAAVRVEGDDLDRLIDEHLRAKLPSLVQELTKTLLPALRRELKKRLVASSSEKQSAGDRD